MYQIFVNSTSNFNRITMVWSQQPDHKCIIQHTTKTVLFFGPAFILIKVVAVNLPSENKKIQRAGKIYANYKSECQLIK